MKQLYWLNGCHIKLPLYFERMEIMDKDYAVKCIAEGMELYFRTFALAENMHHETGDIEWISPIGNSIGPSLVFKVSFDEKTAEQNCIIQKNNKLVEYFSKRYRVNSSIPFDYFAKKLLIKKNLECKKINKLVKLG